MVCHPFYEHCYLLNIGRWGSGESGYSYKEENNMEVVEQIEKALQELGSLLGQPTIQTRENMKVPKR